MPTYYPNTAKHKIIAWMASDPKARQWWRAESVGEAWGVSGRHIRSIVYELRKRGWKIERTQDSPRYARWRVIKTARELREATNG